MDITLYVHVEKVPGEQAFAWWAQSDDLPGFSAAGKTMVELRQIASEAIRAEWPDVAQSASGSPSTTSSRRHETRR
jgi:predicted RNase H-like HicB family nuclease